MKSVLKYLIFFILIPVIFFATSRSSIAEPVDKENITISQLWEKSNPPENRSNQPGNKEKQKEQEMENDLPEITGPEGKSDAPHSYDREDGKYPVYN